MPSKPTTAAATSKKMKTATNPRENEKQQNTPRETADPAELTAGNEERGKCLTEQHTWGQRRINNTAYEADRSSNK